MQEIDKSNEGNQSSRYGAQVFWFVLHTEEGNSSALGLHEWMKTHDVSYHYSLRDGVCVDCVNTDNASWSVLDANPRCINLVFAGSKAAFTREEWLDGYADEIDYAAKLFVQDAAKYNPLDPVVLGKDYGAIGVGRSGGIDHSGITYGLGIGSHTDVGANFPWDVFTAAVKKYLTGDEMVPLPPAENAIDAEATRAEGWIGERITAGENSTPDGWGRWARFENGYVYWKVATGAHAIPTHLFETFAELLWEAGPLGYPVADHTSLPDGDVQTFEGGVLYRKNGQPGFYVHGLIGDRWMRAGFENSVFGWPVSNETPYEGGAYQDFEHGRIVWSPDGTVALQPTDGPDTIIPARH